MKKSCILILALSMALVIICVCRKPKMPVPEYPLNADTISIALQEWGFSCTMEEDSWVRQGRTQWNLYSTENGKLFASVSSAKKDGERILFVSFMPFHTTNAILVDELENAVIFATSLFGGFENTHQVYDNFIHDYDTLNTEKKQYDISSRIRTYPMREGDSRWESSIDGTTCRISLEQPILSEPQEFLGVIMFASNLKTFYPENTDSGISTESTAERNFIGFVCVLVFGISWWKMKESNR